MTGPLPPLLQQVYAPPPHLLAPPVRAEEGPAPPDPVHHHRRASPGHRAEARASRDHIPDPARGARRQQDQRVRRRLDLHRRDPQLRLGLPLGPHRRGGLHPGGDAGLRPGQAVRALPAPAPAGGPRRGGARRGGAQRGGAGGGRVRHGGHRGLTSPARCCDPRWPSCSRAFLPPARRTRSGPCKPRDHAGWWRQMHPIGCKSRDHAAWWRQMHPIGCKSRDHAAWWRQMHPIGCKSRDHAAWWRQMHAIGCKSRDHAAWWRQMHAWRHQAVGRWLRQSGPP